MRFYKITNDGHVSSINTLNADGEGNITEEEYHYIEGLFVNLPVGKQIKDNGDGTYEYVDAPPMPEPDVEPEEALEILLGGAL